MPAPAKCQFTNFYSGLLMIEMKRFFVIAAALLLVSGCIPRSGGDFRIGSSGDDPQISADGQAVIQTPNWQPAIVQRNSKAARGGSYTVLPGDTLFGISGKTGASLSDIADANNLAAPYILKVGQRLDIPSGIYHTVNAGETGIAIARAYGAPWRDIVSLNRLEEPFVLQVGQRLRLPNKIADKQSGGQLSPEQRAAAFSLNIDDVVTGGEPAVASANNAASGSPVSLSTPVARPASFSGSFDWPIDGRLLSSFGSKGGGIVNDGINIAAAKGSIVKAAGDGVVVYSGNEIDVFGGIILVDHGSGWVTAYGHLDGLNVKRGDKLTKGQVLGTVGDTGYVATPQLHFEIRKDRKPLNPLTKLPSRA